MNYQVYGVPFPALILNMTRGETILCQNGAMVWQDECIKMETTTNGGIGKAFGRMFSGESIFLNRFTAQQDGELALGTSFAGNVMAIQITPDKPFVIQKRGFLAMTDGIKMEVFFQKKFGAGFFGGEGFIMQKFSGNGTVFMEIDGSAKEYVLQAGESKLIDTGYLAAMDATCSVDIVTTGSVKNAIFGGEGIWNTRVTGPGSVYLQTKPISSLANSLRPYLPSSSD